MNLKGCEARVDGFNKVALKRPISTEEENVCNMKVWGTADGQRGGPEIGHGSGEFTVELVVVERPNSREHQFTILKMLFGRVNYTELAAAPEGMLGRGPLKELLVMVLGENGEH